MVTPTEKTTASFDNSHAGYRTLNLSNYLNNRGTTSYDERACGGFNIWGNSFLSDDLPSFGEEIEFETIPYILQRIGKDKNDNVVCVGQKLTFPKTHLSGINLIAASERCNVGRFLLVCDGSTDGEISIGVSDFWPEAPANFGNRLFVRGNCLHYPKHRQVNMYPSLWTASGSANNILTDTLILPDNPAIHVFAITLEVPQ